MKSTLNSESVLSLASLGLPLDRTVRKKSYRRNGVHVKCRKYPPKRDKRFKDVVVAPVLGWYPSKHASFTFGVELDPSYLVTLVPKMWNPAVWTHTQKKKLVLRVPKDRGEEGWNRLYEKGFWYHTTKREWFLRRRRSM